MTYRLISHPAAAALIATALTLGACAPNISPNSYKATNAQKLDDVQHGTIVSSRVVNVEGSNSGAGTLIGGATGGVLGSQIGGGFSGHALGAIGGAVLGGVGGTMAEKSLTSQQGYEYTVKLDDGRETSLVQKDEGGPLANGTRVRVVHGSQARVVPE